MGKVVPGKTAEPRGTGSGRRGVESRVHGNDDPGNVENACLGGAENDGQGIHAIDDGHQDAHLLRDSAWLYTSHYVFVAMKFAAGFLVAKFLGPGLFGLRTAFGVAVEYLPFTQLGLPEAMTREVPFHRGRGDAGAAERIQSTVFTANVLIALVTGVPLAGAAAYMAGRVEPVYVEFLLFLAVYGLVHRLRTFYTTRLMTDKRAYTLSHVRMIDGLLYGSLTAVLVYFFSLRGLFIALVLADALIAVYAFHHVRWIPNIGVSARLVWRLMRVGIPIMLITLAFVLFKNVDKLIILGMLTPEDLGQFAVATILSGLVFQSIVDLARVVFFPRLVERVGARTATAEIRGLVVDATVLVAHLVPFLVGAIYIGVHVPLRHLAPDYLPAIDVAKILVLGQCFLAVASIPLLSCVALNRQVTMVVITLLAVALNVAANYALVSGGWGINGVAAGTALSYFVLGTAATTYACRELGDDWRSVLRFHGLLLVPIAYACGWLLALDRWFPTPATIGPGADLWQTAVRFTIFSVCYGLVLLNLRSRPVSNRVRRLAPRRGARKVGTAAALNAETAETLPSHADRTLP